MENSGKPRVSIGMPVFNGEKLIARALDSLLSQDFEDFELVISDNASTDRTGVICREYARGDERISYLLEETNLGAAVNFNKVALLAQGEYFMWAAHDDEWRPSYIGKCVDLLDEHPSAVLALSEIDFFCEDGESLAGRSYDNIDTLGMDVRGRVHELVSRMDWYAVYGLMRTEALRSTRLAQPRFGSDVLLLLELLLLGDFVKVPEALFRYYVPEQRKTARDNMQDITGENCGGLVEKPYLNMARDLLEIIRTSELDPLLQREIRDDVIHTLAAENRGWRAAIMEEQGYTPRLHYPGRRISRLMRKWLAPAVSEEGGHG